jgi:hypothetical protein
LFGRDDVVPDAMNDGAEEPDFERAARKACVAGFAIETLLYC